MMLNGENQINMNKQEVNFFWSGDGFTFIHKCTILSHLRVGHTPIIWLYGDTPKSKYWDLPKEVIIKNANDIFDISNFMKNGGGIKPASSLWRWYFLYECGGLYCDTDAFAYRKFDDSEWIIASGEKEDGLISTGVIKVPPKQEMFKYCIDNIKPKWGNVRIFTDAFKKYHGEVKYSHDNKLFYPFSWKEFKVLIEDDKEMNNPFSVHLYHTMLENNLSTNEDIVKKYPKSLITRLFKGLV